MSRFVVGKGSAMVEVDDGAARFVERVLRKAANVTMTQIDIATAEVAGVADAEWPEKTGNSRRGLKRAIRFLPPDTIEGVIYNRVPYVYFIKGKRQMGKHTWTVLVREPMKRKATVLAARLGTQLRLAGQVG